MWSCNAAVVLALALNLRRVAPRLALSDVAGAPGRARPEGPSSPRRLWSCNAEFDLTLPRGGNAAGLPASLRETARAMAWHLWPALSPRDALLVPAPPPPGYRESLEALGLMPPTFVTNVVTNAVTQGVVEGEAMSAASPPPNPDFLFTPFGWNVEAVRQSRTFAKPAAHPDPEIVRRVNGREFGMALERELFGNDACPAVFCRDVVAVDAWCLRAAPGRYVAKGQHGHAGIGQLRFTMPDDAASIPARLRRLCARHGGIAIEVAQEVACEWGLLFRLGVDGRLSSFRRHRLLADADGGYAGALIAPTASTTSGVSSVDAESHVWEAHRVVAEEGARRVAKALHRAGYFGPVGLDLYAHRTAGETRLRPLVDLNARMTMAWPAHGMAARFPDRWVRFEQFSAVELRAPSDPLSLRRKLDKMSFDSETRVGVIWITPLLNLPRHSLAFVGASEADVQEMRKQVRTRFLE